MFCHYFKMLQFGTPLDAVKYRLTIDGYAISIMDLNPNRSLELQLDQLDVKALETLRSKGIIDNTNVSAKNYTNAEKNDGSASDNTESDNWDSILNDYQGGPTEVSILDTLRRFIFAFRRRRSNQIFAASALFDETKYALLERSNNKAPIFNNGN